MALNDPNQDQSYVANPNKELEDKYNKINEDLAKNLESTDNPLDQQYHELRADYSKRSLAGQPTSRLENFMHGKADPFFRGMRSTTEDDIFNPNYRRVNPNATYEDMTKTKAYNKKLEELSGRRQFWTAGAKGLGALASVGIGGLHGNMIGQAISYGIPLAQDWLHNRAATKEADKAWDEARFMPQRQNRW